MKVYKIRHKVTGEYSTGGMYVFWNKRGKTWNTIGHMKAHLRMLEKYEKDISRDMKNWEVLELEIVEASKTDALEFLK